MWFAAIKLTVENLITFKVNFILWWDCSLG